MRVEPSDLKQYLPNYYDGVLEIDVLMDVENALFDKLKNHLQNVLDNQFVFTCDVQMLYRYEQMLNIRPDTVLETIEFRRMRVINRLSSRQPFTYWFYRQALDTLFGRDNSTLIVDYNSYLLNVNISTFDMPAYDEFINHLRITKPVNLTLSLRLTHEFPKFRANHASATISGELVSTGPKIITDVRSKGTYRHGSTTISGESVLMGPRVITDVEVSGIYYHGSTTVSGEAVTMSPMIKTGVEVSGGHHYGFATVSGESLTTTPPVTTEVKVSGVYYQGLVMVSGEVVTISPPVSTAIKINGQTYQGTVMISGELVELSPRISARVESTGRFSKSHTTVSGEKIEIYPKGVQ